MIYLLDLASVSNQNHMPTQSDTILEQCQFLRFLFLTDHLAILYSDFGALLQFILTFKSEIFLHYVFIRCMETRLSVIASKHLKKQLL